MKIMITGGGTGGHIYPAIAIADEFRQRDEKIEILFVGARIGMEKDIVPECGYEIELIDADGFGRNLRNNVKAARRVMRGRREARDLILNFSPDAVIGTGGYASAPVVSCAEKMGIPTYIHEQNAIPGKTNRFLAKKARRVFLGFSKAGAYLNSPEKHVLVGNPVRREFEICERSDARRKLGVDPDDFVILAFGGSQGAGRLNREMVRVILSHRDDDDFSIYLGTGAYYYDAILAELEDKGVEQNDRIHVMKYIHDMADILNCADLIVSRSGALTVAEVTACGVPAIFVPFPDATENHQYYNALNVASAGGAVIIEEKDLGRDEMNKRIDELRADPARLMRMRENCASCGTLDAARRICDEIEEDLKNLEKDGRDKEDAGNRRKDGDQ